MPGIAILAITAQGAALGERLAQSLPQSKLWVLEKYAPAQAQAFSSTAQAVADLWPQVDGLICLFSLGVVVRSVAPHLKSKHEDPAVVCVDEAGAFAIAVLSGHVGGANALAEQVSGILGAQAVITTASDSLGTLAVDILGRELGWVLEGKEKATAVSAAVVHGSPVAFVQECGSKNWWARARPLPENIKVFGCVEDALGQRQDWGAVLVVSDRDTETLNMALGALAGQALYYRPKTLFIGMGCDRGLALARLQFLAENALAKLGLSALSVAGLASVDLKKDEEGLIALAQGLGVPFTTYTAQELNQIPGVAPSSAFVFTHTGAHAVAEPAALRLAGPGSALILNKIKGQGCTLALARKPD
jgi:cobalt-precorrin 5A hydrolase